MSNNENTTALILAAGIGKRLRGMTDIPKSLLKIQDETLLARHVRIWRNQGIKNIVAVLGYQKELIEDELSKVASEMNITVVVNEDPVAYGNTFSLWLGLKACKPSNIVVFDADLAYDESVVADFLQAGDFGRILVGPSSLDDVECAKALVDYNDMVRLTVDKRAVSKEELEQYSFSGEAVGALWFSANQAKSLNETCEAFLAIEKNRPLNWEHVMNVYLKEHDLKSFQVGLGRWIEIDTSEDYEKAVALFKE